MYSEDELNYIHDNLLEQLSNLSYCSNFILTEKQLNLALDNNKSINVDLESTIIHETYTSTNTTKYSKKPVLPPENTNIYNLVLQKFKKYKIIGVKIWKGESQKHFMCYPIYITFINIHGECYNNYYYECSYFTDYNYQSGMTFYNFINLYLEIFVKPFAGIPKYIENNKEWLPYLNPEKYSSLAEPNWKEYIKSDKIIPKSFIDDLINKLNTEIINGERRQISNCYYIYIEYKEEQEKKLKQQKEKELKEIKERNRIQSWEKIMGVPYKYTSINCAYEDFDTTVLNLSDEIEITKKEFIDYKLIKYTDCSFIRINDGNFKTINLNCKGVKIISLYKCEKFEELTGQFKENIRQLYIDGKLYFDNNKIIEKQLETKNYEILLLEKDKEIERLKLEIKEIQKFYINS